MSDLITTTVGCFKKYRQKLGFSNQTDVKNFFRAKDITQTIDLNYIKLLNERLYCVVEKINNIVTEDVKIDNLIFFKKQYIDNTFNIMKDKGVLKLFNNQGRRPEQVYYSWMRGYVLLNYFLKAISFIFEVDISKINLIGDDDFKNIKTFKRTPKADLEINLNEKEKIRIEMQTGYIGVNDIKQHKVLEAKRIFNESGVRTLVIHLDLYNGQVAFVMLDSIKEVGEHWITRPQFEGVVVFEIEQKFFVWKITEKPVKYKEMNFD